MGANQGVNDCSRCAPENCRPCNASIDFENQARSGFQSAQVEAANFRPNYRFFKAFLEYPRDERQKVVQDALLEGQDQAPLKDIVSKLNAAVKLDDVKLKSAPLASLYERWNVVLQEVEKDFPDQAPSPSKCIFDEGTVCVILGGKYTESHRGVGDEIVAKLIVQDPPVKVFALARSGGDQVKTGRNNFQFFTDYEELFVNVKKAREGPKGKHKVVFFFTIGTTGDNGGNESNETLANDFLALCDKYGMLNDPSVKVVQTSTYHASPKEANHEDNLADNYGLADYGASKVMQTLQFIDAMFRGNPNANKTEAFRLALQLREKLQQNMDIVRSHWKSCPADAAARKCPENFKSEHKALVEIMSEAANLVFEDTAGVDSIIRQLQNISCRFDVVKIPYMMSKTAVYKRLFIFDPKVLNGMTPWQYLQKTSMKRLKIVITPERGALWHIAVAKELLDN